MNSVSSSRNWRYRFTASAVFALLNASVFSSHAYAAGLEIDPSNYGGFNSQEMVNSVVETIGIMGAHNPYLSATPQGLVLGVDLGVTVSAFGTPQAFTDAVTAIAPGATIPSMIPVPKLALSKGLPFGVDVGLSYIKALGLSSIGGHAQYAIIGGGLVLPSLAVRAAYNRTDISFVESTTMNLDVVVSKPLALILDPYVGVGLQKVSGEIDLAAATGFPGSLTASHSFTSPRLFVGLPVSLAILKITAQYDYSFTGISSYGAKFAFSF